MRIAAISDLHGHLPREIPGADLLVIAGDVCPDVPGSASIGRRGEAAGHQLEWIRRTFAPWLEQLAVPHIVMCWGNHDYVGESALALPPLRARVLTDEAATIAGLRIYATPWTFAVPEIWAFDVEPSELAKYMEAIPAGIDVLVTHSPPFHVLDRLCSGLHVGSPALAEAVVRVRPRAHVFGHIHEARGQEGASYNVAILNEEYQPYDKPIATIDLST